MTEKISLTIIGGGVIGCALAYELSQTRKEKICILEKNKKIRGENQSSRNSGVIHAGIYYPREESPLKAEFCAKGNRLLYEFCEKFKVPHLRTGKIVVATNSLEEEYLDDLLETAAKNGVPGVRKISRQEAKELEPKVCCASALYVPTTGIIDSVELVQKLYSLASQNGAIFAFGNKVTNISPKENAFEVISTSGNVQEKFETEILINAAGLYSDEIAKMIDPDSPYEITPVRGEAAKFYKNRRGDLSLKSLNIYPAPYGYYFQTGERAKLPLEEFKRLFERKVVGKTVGVHLTPTFELKKEGYGIGQEVTLGPLYATNVGKEDYTFSHSEKDFLERVKDFFPALELSDLFLHQAGIQAKLKGRSDFVVEPEKKYPRCLNLLGIDSPGLTSCLAIAQYVRKWVDNLGEGIER